MNSLTSNPKLRAVYVVETWLKSQKKWFVWTARSTRPTARVEANEAREMYPDQKFRVTKYVSTKP